jgi:hypothetical protein
VCRFRTRSGRGDFLEVIIRTWAPPIEAASRKKAGFPRVVVYNPPCSAACRPASHPGQKGVKPRPSRASLIQINSSLKKSSQSPWDSREPSHMEHHDVTPIHLVSRIVNIPLQARSRSMGLCLSLFTNNYQPDGREATLAGGGDGWRLFASGTSLDLELTDSGRERERALSIIVTTPTDSSLWGFLSYSNRFSDRIN